MVTPDTDVKTGLVKGLGLMDATTLVMGSMIGSGIFIVSADIARQVDSPALLILVWLIGAALTVAAALSYGAVAFAKYAGVFVPWVSAQNYLLGEGKVGLTTHQLLAIAVVVLLTLVNTRGIRTGALVQNVFTFAKIASLAALVGFGFFLGRND